MTIETAYILMVLVMTADAPKPQVMGEYFKKENCEKAGAALMAATSTTGKIIFMCLPK